MELVRQTDSAFAEVTLVTRAVLLAQGFRQHARGQWRRARRGGRDEGVDQRSMDQNPSLRDLVEAAQGRRPGARKQLEEFLTRSPVVFTQAAEQLRHVRGAWDGLLTGLDQPLAEEASHEQQTELLASQVAALKQLLAERVVVCRLMVEQARLSAAKTTEISIAHSRFLEEREHAAEHRLGIAERALRTVQRLLLTAVQGSSR